MSLRDLENALLHRAEFGPIGEVLKLVQNELESLHANFAALEERLDKLAPCEAQKIGNVTMSRLAETAAVTNTAVLPNHEDAVDSLEHIPHINLHD
jgi:hypothetical protein